MYRKLFATCCLLLSFNAWSSVEFVFCYENKEVLPHFYTNSVEVPEDNPGPAVTVMKSLDEQLPNIHITFVRLPWQRCLIKLFENTVTGVLAAYTKARSTLAKYPMNQGIIDKSRSYYTSHSCLITRPNSTVTWDGKQLSSKKEFTVGIPKNYVAVDHIRSLGAKVFETDSESLSFDLVNSGRIEASIINCASPAPKGLKIHKPAIYSNYGYLLLSTEFYEQHPQLSETMWNALRDIDVDTIYKNSTP